MKTFPIRAAGAFALATAVLLALAPHPANAAPLPAATDHATAAAATVHYPLREGDPFSTDHSRCIIGGLVETSNAQTGFVTAGQCGNVGDRTFGFNHAPQGVFRASVFPGRDFALVVVNDDWVPAPSAQGSREAPIGATVCMLSPTGVRCGTLTQKNLTVNYPQGAVVGLSRTTICSEPGDVGAPVYAAGGQLQGFVSGGSGNCTVGGVTFFQPINPVLSALGLSLILA